MAIFDAPSKSSLVKVGCSVKEGPEKLKGKGSKCMPMASALTCSRRSWKKENFPL